MFGEPIHQSEVDYFKILGWVWNYMFKEDTTNPNETKLKARATVNGSQVVTLAEIYAVSVDQPAHRLTWALAATLI